MTASHAPSLGTTGRDGNGEFIPMTAHVEMLSVCEGGTCTYLQQIPFGEPLANNAFYGSVGSDGERISVCESTGEHYRHYDCYQTTAIVIRREQLPLVRWQEAVELCRVLTEETADHRDVDSGDL